MADAFLGLVLEVCVCVCVCLCVCVSVCVCVEGLGFQGSLELDGRGLGL